MAVVQAAVLVRDRGCGLVKATRQGGEASEPRAVAAIDATVTALATADGRERAQARKAVVLIVVVWLAFVLPFLRGQVRFPVDFAGPEAGHTQARLANPEHGDAYYAMYPWHLYLGQRLRAGDIPLWDPHRFAGTPYAADIAMGVWYPPNWLYAFGHTLHVFTLISVASSLVALLVMYWFLRLLRLHPYAAAFGAVAFAFSAFVVKWATNDTVLGSIVWVALPLAGLELARQGRRWRGTVVAAAGLALVVLSGHAQLAIYVWLIAMGWAGLGVLATVAHLVRARPVAAGTVVRHLVREAVPAVAAVVLALGLSAVQLLPTQQLVKGIVRQRTTWAVARATFLPHQHAATMLLPDYLGSPVDGNYDGPGVNYTETMLYAGLLTLPLAVHGVAHRRRRAAVFFAGLAVTGLLLVFGSPLYRVVLVTPGLSRGLFATRFILLVDLGLAGLAALGLDRLLRGTGTSRRSLAALAGTFAVLAAVVGWLGLGRPGTDLPASYVTPLAVRGLAVLALGAVAIGALVKAPAWAGRMAVVVVVACAGDLWATGYRFNPFHNARPVYPVQSPIGELQAVGGARPRFADVGNAYVVPPNGALVYGLYGLAGYDPLIPRPIVDLLGVAENQIDRAHANFVGPFRPSTAVSPVFDLLGIDDVVGRVDQVPVPGAAGSPLLRRPGAFPPAFLTSCWDLVAADRVLDRVAAMTSGDLRTTAVVDDAAVARRALGPGAGTPDAGSACTGGDATVGRYDPERVTLDVNADVRSVAVLSDSWFPGWQATVDGRAVPVLRVDHALRGVVVGPGTHRIEMRFRPSSFTYGAALSVSTIAVIGGAGAVTGVRRRRRSQASPDGDDAADGAA